MPFSPFGARVRSGLLGVSGAKSAAQDEEEAKGGAARFETKAAVK